MSKARPRGNFRSKVTGKESQLRIIGGEWRGRKLRFTPEQGLRPTTDRIRETLFNWLAPHINGARCADLFAGSGALGIEALSRGALHCEFIEPNHASCAQIERHLEMLGAAQRGTYHKLTAREFLASASQTYDIVFIDPPFSQELVTPTCELLVESRVLAEFALIYIESSAAETCPSVPSQWKPHREKISGGVAYRLFQVGTLV